MSDCLETTGPTVDMAVENGLHTLVFRKDKIDSWVLQPTKIGSPFSWDAPAEWTLQDPFQSIISKGKNLESPISLLTITRINEDLNRDEWFKLIGCFKPVFNPDYGHYLSGWVLGPHGRVSIHKSSSIDNIHLNVDIGNSITEIRYRRIIFTFIFANSEARNLCLPHYA